MCWVQVLDAKLEKAKIHATAGNWAAAVAVYDDILTNTKKLTSNKRIDAMCDKCRIALFCMDMPRLTTLVEETKALNDSGGDWDRRNRLKVRWNYL